MNFPFFLCVGYFGLQSSETEFQMIFDGLGHHLRFFDQVTQKHAFDLGRNRHHPKQHAHQTHERHTHTGIRFSQSQLRTQESSHPAHSRHAACSGEFQKRL